MPFQLFYMMQVAQVRTGIINNQKGETFTIILDWILKWAAHKMPAQFINPTNINKFLLVEWPDSFLMHSTDDKQ